MSGVLRRGSLNFASHLNNKNSPRGSQDSNLNGGYRDKQSGTPEISVITLDFQRYSEDLKKDGDSSIMGESIAAAEPREKVRDLSKDDDSDEISNFIGHYGLWQFVWSFLLSLFVIPVTFHLFAFVFQTRHGDFWCDEDGDYNITKNVCILKLFNSKTDEVEEIQCTKFRFENNVPFKGISIVEEFGLVCDQSNMVSNVEMCFLVGAALASVASGWISDRYGRKHTLMTFATFQVVFGSTAAFSSSLTMFMMLRVILGFASMTVAVVCLVLVVELVSGKWRTIIGILNILPMSISYVLTAGLAYFIQDWRILQVVISLPWAALLLTWYWVPESPRWLLAAGRLEELYALIETAARWDRRKLPADYQKTLVAGAFRESTIMEALAIGKRTDSLKKGEQNIDQLENSAPPNAVEKINPFFVAFNPIYLRTTCLNLVVWLTLVMLYFGLTLHLDDLGGDIYVNTAIVGSAEAVSVLLSIPIVLKFGARPILIVFMLIAGVCCLLTNIMPDGDSRVNAVITLAMIAKCVIGANNAIIPIYTAGQYPTEVRNFGVGMGNLAAGIALILVPYLWRLEPIRPLLPLTIMGVGGLIGAVALYLMNDDALP